MRCGHFYGREYVVTRPDVPVSFTNYLGLEDFVTVISHNAGGYSFYQSPRHHRITRFRPNGVPKDRPGHYVYVRDDDTGEYWSLSWQPVGGSLTENRYEARHGLSYSRFLCERGGILGGQTLFVPQGDAAELWDVKLENRSGRARSLSVFGYCEFSFRHAGMDNQNFQESLCAAGSRFIDGVIECRLRREENGRQFFTADFEPDGFDTLRDSFIGDWRTETNPAAVEAGACSGSQGTTGNHCGALMKRVRLEAGEGTRLLFILGEGGGETARALREKYSDADAVDHAFNALGRYWDNKLSVMQIDTPHSDMNLMTNTWTLYQAGLNVLFPHSVSFAEPDGDAGPGFHDAAQDALCIPSAEPEGCRRRLLQLLEGQSSEGYGLRPFPPECFGDERSAPGDALWLAAAVCEYIRETGERDFCGLSVPFADGGETSVYEHLKRAVDFASAHTGVHGIARRLCGDRGGGGESALSSFLYVWAAGQLAELAKWLGRKGDAGKYRALREKAAQTCEAVLWDGRSYRQGFPAEDREEGADPKAAERIFLESNVWAVLSGAAAPERARGAMDAVERFLYTDYGLLLNAPGFPAAEGESGLAGRDYPGVRENGAILSHSNPWAWAAECVLGRGDRAMKYYDALCPARYNYIADLRRAEPYSYCQFIMGRDHPLHGRANNPWLTGAAGWAYYAVTQYILGIRPGYDCLRIDPCIPRDWKGFSATRRWRGAEYRITVKNLSGVEKGAILILQDGCSVEAVKPVSAGSVSLVDVVMG